MIYRRRGEYTCTSWLGVQRWLGRSTFKKVQRHGHTNSEHMTDDTDKNEKCIKLMHIYVSDLSNDVKQPHFDSGDNRCLTELPT